MELSESKLFTIEALNRIEGFEWPEWAQLAQFDAGSKIAIFNSYINEETAQDCVAYGSLVGVTKEEFKSVDGWVRNDGSEPAIYGSFDLLLDDGEILDPSDLSVDGWDWAIPCNNGNTISHWRYHTPQAQVKQSTPQPDTGIETLISQHKAAKQSTLEARRMLEQAEAAEHSLLLSIEAWAESNGFDIRLLDESKEKPDLVVTDWRDLQKGDVVQWNIPGNNCNLTIDEIFRDGSGGNPCASIISASGSKFTAYPDEIKFIRRPAKGEK